MIIDGTACAVPFFAVLRVASKGSLGKQVASPTEEPKIMQKFYL